MHLCWYMGTIVSGSAGRDVDADLVHAIRDQDQSAFAAMVDRHHGQMMRVAYLICRDRHLADDAIQTAWLQAWRRLADLRDAQRLRSWLLTLAANEARQLMRRRRRQARTLPVEVALATEEAIANHVDLQQGLARLSVDDRALIALRYLADLSSVEIAATQRVSASAVRGRLARAVQRLRMEMIDE